MNKALCIEEDAKYGTHLFGCVTTPMSRQNSSLDSLEKLAHWYSNANDNSVTDLDYILSRDLSRSRDFFNCDAGTIYVAEKDESSNADFLRFGYVQNDTKKLNSYEYISSCTKIPIDSSSIAGHVAKTKETLCIPDVYDLNGVPFSFNKKFDVESGYRTRSMIVTPLFDYNNNVIGVLQLINKKGQEGESFSREDVLCAEIISKHVSGALDKALTSINHALSLVKMATLYDPYETGAHAQRVGTIGIEIAKQMNVSYYTDPRLRGIFRNALMSHDIGKIGIPQGILTREGRPTPEEFVMIKTHPKRGHEFLSENSSLIGSLGPEVALSHHEKWDGTGYPNGLIGDEIPLSGRITAVADVYDAAKFKRCYKNPMSFEEVCDLIKNGSGTHFDPQVVDAFNASKEQIYKITQRFSN